jgi:hypothetical protein
MSVILIPHRFSYLPPPVLNVLDNKSIEATKRAAMLTTALQWLLAKIPLAAVPPQMKPGVMIAKRLVPYVGYVGAAIAWSWSAIRGYDKGSVATPELERA